MWPISILNTWSEVSVLVSFCETSRRYDAVLQSNIEVVELRE